MKKTKILTCMIALTLVAGLMTGCGSKAKETADTAESTEVVETETEETETEETAPVVTEVSLEDADTGITVEGMADASDVKVADVDEDTDASIKELAATDLTADVAAVASYDISIVNTDGDTVQPEGDITVTIPLTDEMKDADGNAYAVYYFNPDDSTVQNMDCSVSEDNVTFQTTHFSVYSVVKFTDPAMEPEPIAETEEDKTVAESGKEETPVAESDTNTSTPAVADLPGINRNGRYADLPESVMPASAAENIDFYDNPIEARVWDDDVVANIYADYNMTQLIKSSVYSVDGYNDTVTIIAEEYNTCNAIAIYNGQYVVVKSTAFEYMY